MLPMDAYMGDLNSGQSWYRPSYMLVAVLKGRAGAAPVSGGHRPVFNHFYRHDFALPPCHRQLRRHQYRDAAYPKGGISREGRGDESTDWTMTVALPYMAIKDRDLESGKKVYDYLPPR